MDRTKTLSDDSKHVFQFKFPLKFDGPTSDGTRNSVAEAMDRLGSGLLRQDHGYSYDVVSASDSREESRGIEDDKILLPPEEESIPKESQLGREILGHTNDFNHDDDGDDDDDGTDVLREHENLVRQMKMELRNCRVKGLPTISEELEPPKMLEDDLKPFKAEPKFDFKGAMEEIQTFYKIYAEKMKKLDVLNYQTLQAISFREVKGKEGQTPRDKRTGGLRPLASARAGKCDARKVYVDSSQRSMAEMYWDLELVYAGQLCLSWEVLVWSYEKGRELLGHDGSKGSRSYNRAYEEFQQFQVVLQRFVEDEPFQGGGGGGRTVCYAKRRCAVRNLLQVPMIKDDCCKAKKERTEEMDAISLEALLSVIKESMMVFRDFVYADKRAVNDVSKGVRGNKFDDKKESSDSRLLGDVIEALHKKERRMRESIRSQSCMIKKLKRQQQRSENEALKSQVELRLVWKVVSLPKLSRDQMLWCKMKLDNIGFVGTKVVQVETSSFSLLPC